MDRAAHQCPLDNGPPLEGARQSIPSEPFQPRPQPDVGGWGVLRLKPADAFDGPRDRKIRRFEQELPGEQRAVAFALGKGALGHEGGV